RYTHKVSQCRHTRIEFPEVSISQNVISYSPTTKGSYTMETVYKLTDSKNQTYNETQWGPGVTHTAPGGGDLCSNKWIHAYPDPVLAVFMNSVHADFKPARLWEANGEVGIRKPDKIGCTSLTTIRRIKAPKPTLTQTRAF